MMASARFRNTLPLALLLLVFTCAPLFAQEEDVLVLDEDKPAPPAPTGKPEISLPQETDVSREAINYQTFYRKWYEYLQAQSDPEASSRIQKEILDLKNERSVPRLTGLALSSIRLGKSYLQEQNVDAALSSFRFASALDPTLPEAHYAQSIAHLQRGVAGIGAAIGAGAHGFFAPRGHLRGRAYFQSKITALILGAIALAAAAFAVVLLIKYNNLLRHDLEERFSQKHQPALVHLAVWVILFLPALLFFGPLWLAPFWFMIFSLYAKISEKIVAVVLMVVFVVAYPAYRQIVHRSVSLQNPEAAVFSTAFLEGPSPAAVMELEQHLQQDPKDHDAVVLLASLHNRNGETDRALDLLQGLMQEEQTDPRAPNNLAAIYFARGELDYALRLAQRAAELDGRSALYKFNLSNIYRAKFNFTDANRHMDEARRADPVLVQSMQTSASERVVEDVPTPELLDRKVKNAGGSFLSFLPNLFSFLAVLLLGTTVYRAFVAETPRIARACTKCGKPFCKKCQPNVKISGFCIQCLHIFVRKDGVSPASRKEKMEEIDLHLKRQRLFTRISSLVLPGAGSLLQDRTLSGLAVLLPWFFLVSLLGFTYKYAGVFFFEPEESFRIVSMVCILLMVVLYIVANLVLIRKARTG